jgi:hypothetical protein
MRLPSIPSAAVVEHLNDTYFHTVWNAPREHARANFRLQPLSNRLSLGAVSVNQSVVGLPTTDTVYAVYSVPVSLFGRFVAFPNGVWTKDAAVFTQYAVALLVYTPTGRLMPVGQTWLRYDRTHQRVLVAVDERYVSKCSDQLYPELYATVYRDLTRITPIVTNTYVVGTAPTLATTRAATLQAIADASVRYPNQTTVYVNGWMYLPADVPTLVTGDVVSIVSDPDILGFCTLNVDSNQTGYYSEKFSEYREALHIPKILNPTNMVFTTDTLTMGVFDTVTKRGLYGQRIDAHTLESITHNDFSVSRSILQGYQNTLGAQGVSVRLYVRASALPHSLGDDVNRIQDLYTLSDAEIKLQLAGLSAHQMPEWSAAHLEQSAYLPLLYQTRGYGVSDILATYSAAMGYYDVASTLSQAMHYYTYRGAEVAITKPARLFGIPCQAMVYADGRKIADGDVVMTNESVTIMRLGFKTSAKVALGARIAVYMTDALSRAPVLYQPTEKVPAIILPSEDFVLMVATPVSSAVPVWQGSANVGYRLLPVSPGDYHITPQSDGTVAFEVSPPHYDTTLYAIPQSGMVSQRYDIDSFIANSAPVVTALTMETATGEYLPLMGYNALEVYLNGARLVEDVDYAISQIPDVNGNIFQTLLKVSNSDYFIDQGNVLEIVTHGDAAVSSNPGYVLSNVLRENYVPPVWSLSCGRAFVNGKLLEKVVSVGNQITSAVPQPDGALYLVEWNMALGAEKLLSGLSATDTLNFADRVSRLLNIAPVTPPATVVVSHLHALYSPYLAQIIHDVWAKTFVIADEVKDDSFLRQFTRYAPLRDADPILGNNPKLDRRFVTLAAHYINLAVQDPQQMLLIQRLITLALAPAPLSIREVLI